MAAIDNAILALWGVFCLFWLLAAAAVKERRADSRTHASFSVRIVVTLAVVAIVLLRTRVFGGGIGIVDAALFQALGLVVLLAGLAIAVWARLYLGRNWGTPMSERVDPELVTSGPYRWVRHPIYSGIILALIGTAIATGVYWLVVVAIIAGYFIYSAVVEERNMARLFPQTYPAYRRSSKMLIPFVL